jgi:hypothetical protein
MQRKKSKVKKDVKEKVVDLETVKKKREPYICSKNPEPECPRCGEKVAIKEEGAPSFYGVRRFRCFSETCKNNGANKGAGRGFTVPKGKSNCKRIKAKRNR